MQAFSGSDLRTPLRSSARFSAIIPSLTVTSHIPTGSHSRLHAKNHYDLQRTVVFGMSQYVFSPFSKKENRPVTQALMYMMTHAIRYYPTRHFKQSFSSFVSPMPPHEHIILMREVQKSLTKGMVISMKSGKCTATFETMTLATKAQHTLASAAIRSEVVKLDSSYSGHGCAWGLDFSCAQENNVRTILGNARIPVRRFLDGGGLP